MAIIGLDTYFGTCRDAREFARAVAHGQRCVPMPEALRGVELALRVANNALFDAHATQDAPLAVLWAGEAAAAAEIVALWRFTGPAPALADGPTALAEALRLLSTGAVDVALVGETGAMGGVALVLSRPDIAADRRVYAFIHDDERPGMTASLPGYWEWPALADGVLPASAPAPEPTCALGSVSTNLGNDAPALAALARTALCLYHRVIPATPDWRGPRAPQNNAPFYVAPAPQPWLTEGERMANCTGQMAHGGMVLSASPAVSAVPVLHAHMAARPFFMFPLAADERDGILALMADLRQQATQGMALESLADDVQAVYQTRPDARYALALLAHDRDELWRELDFAVKGVEKAFAEGKDWTSPLGSSFTAHPQGPTGKVAFVYPGAFSSYVGMGRDLFQLFPHLHARFAAVTHYASRATGEKLLYPRHLTPPTAADARADEARLHANPTAVLESGASFAILYTSALRDVFGVEPTAALGYSLGEVSMLWALGVWPDGDAGSDAWNTTPLFKTRLFGPQDAVREYWGLEANTDEKLWCSYIVKAPLEQVKLALEAEPRAYLTIVNEEREAVIAGHPDACAHVIAALNCHALQMSFDAAIHAPAIQSEYPAFVDLFTLPTRPVYGIDFYSAAEYAPLTLERDALAHALAKMTCAPLDFPRLVRTIYDDAGARIFIELGPLGACSRWIDRILGDRPHAAVPINKSGKSDYDSLLPVLAMLTTQRVQMKPESSVKNPRVGASVQPPVGDSVPPHINGAASDEWRVTNDELRLTEHTARSASYTIKAHLAFLQARQTAMRQTAELMAMQIAAAGEMLQEAAHQPIGESRLANHESPLEDYGLRTTDYAPLLTEDQLRAFAIGDMVEAFGPAYARYRGRRGPRLPNGDLLCMSRVLTIDGAPGQVTPGAVLVSEFDVQADAWFFRDCAALPTSMLMEMALQPCGVLSIYLGSMLLYPDSDFYFRNLDGEGELLRAVDGRGQTIANRVTLLSSTALPGIILQKFGFELACAGEVFYRGVASFGYFTPEALQRQAGLDGGVARRPWLWSTDLTAGTDLRALKSVPAIEVKRMKPLDLLDRAWCIPGGGEEGRGYVYAEVPVSPDDWFFKCHFYQDPVMPGSLGVEALTQAMQVYAQAQGCGLLMPVPGRTIWKYRGQVPPESQRLRLEVHIKEKDFTPEGIVLVGDGSLWRGEQRIYEVRDLGIGSRK